MKLRTLIKNHETEYIKNQGNLNHYFEEYEIRGTSAYVFRQNSSVNYDGKYIVRPSFNSRGEHAWNGGSEI